MITRVLAKVDHAFKVALKLTGKVNTLLERLGDNRDAEINKRFLKENQQRPPSEDFINSRMESMENSQGVTGFSGSGYKGPGKVNHDKIISNRARNLA